MWLPGHVAVGFLLSLVAVLLYLRTYKSLLLPLAYVAFFSVLPDFLHLGDLRAFSHSIFGAVLLLVAALLILWRIHGWRPLLALVALLSLGSHLLADLYIGHIFPWYPWSVEFVQHNQFNTLYDIRVELFLCALAAVPLLYLLTTQRGASCFDDLGRRDLVASIALMAPFFLLCLGQVLYFVVLDIIDVFTISSALLLAIFMGILLLSIMGLTGAIRAFTKEF